MMARLSEKPGHHIRMKAALEDQCADREAIVLGAGHERSSPRDFTPSASATAR